MGTHLEGYNDGLNQITSGVYGALELIISDDQELEDTFEAVLRKRYGH